MLPVSLWAAFLKCSRSRGRGAHGHIALQTEDVEAAMADLADKGVTFDQDSIRRRADGKISVVYLEGKSAVFLSI